MATFKTIHTTYGLTRMTQAEASGTPINLPQIAVGDGNGNPVVPQEGQTQLAREIYRAAVNRVFQDPNTPNMFTAELVIPATVGGFVMREVGVFDDQGGLFAVGNLPETYKPVATEGAYADTVVRISFAVTNTGVVNIILDPNIAVVTQTWFANHFNAATVIPGGLTNQILTKKSNADGDFQWQDPTKVNIVVNTIEEQQTLAAGQTVVNLTTTNTSGLAVYVEGNRLRADEWTADPVVKTRLTLAQSYQSGWRLTAVQNEPASALSTALQAVKNLSDVADVPTARTNLGVYSKSEVDGIGKQAGEVFFTARAAAPTGSLKANGAAVSRTAYAALFAAIGTTYGAGDGFNTFNLPDLRGEFLRALDDGRGVDSGRALGSFQAGQIMEHDHVSPWTGIQGGAYTYPNTLAAGMSRAQIAAAGLVREAYTDPNATAGVTDATNTPYTPIAFKTTKAGTPGVNDNRPRNVALLACIKY